MAAIEVIKKRKLEYLEKQLKLIEVAEKQYLEIVYPEINQVVEPFFNEWILPIFEKTIFGHCKNKEEITHTGNFLIIFGHDFLY